MLSRMIDVNNSALHFLHGGSRDLRPLIFVHAFPLSSQMWEAQFDFFSKNYSVYAYDIRGLGKSQVGDGQYTLEILSDDLIAFMDAMEIESAIWCGLSLGGYIVLRAIEKYPERCSALALCNTRSDADANEAKLKRANAIKTIKEQGLIVFAETFLQTAFTNKHFQENATCMQKAREMILSNSPTGVCGLQLAMGMRTDTTESLQRIKVPTLILAGQEDNITPLPCAENLRAKIPNSKLLVIEHAAHMSAIENPKAFNENLNSFLQFLK